MSSGREILNLRFCTMQLGRELFGSAKPGGWLPDWVCTPLPPLLAASVMVPRYSRPAMTAIWSPENRYRIWWAIEVFAAEAMGEIGMIPADDARTIRAAYDADVLGDIDVPAIDAIEVTKHDVTPSSVGGESGPEARYLHQA